MPQRVESITIYSSEYPRGCIYGFSFVYVDQQGKLITVGPWGNAYPAFAKTIKMGLGEHLNNVSGTADDSGITSLQLETNQTKHGPYGCPAGAAFSMPLQQGKGKVVAFFGRSGNTLKALGVYVPGKTASPVKVGPWGGSSGTPRDINPRQEPVKLESFTVHSTQYVGGRIYGFSFTYVDLNGQSIRVGPWGKANGQPQTVRTIFNFLFRVLLSATSSSCMHVDVVQFSMNEGEYVKSITGTAQGYGVTSLKFTTNQDVYGPFGTPSGSGNTFSVPLPDNSTGVNPNGAVVAFFGRSGDSLVAYVGLEPEP
jgi:hypothetical protein